MFSESLRTLWNQRMVLKLGNFSIEVVFWQWFQMWKSLELHWNWIGFFYSQQQPQPPTPLWGRMRISWRGCGFLGADADFLAQLLSHLVCHLASECPNFLAFFPERGHDSVDGCVADIGITVADAASHRLDDALQKGRGGRCLKESLFTHLSLQLAQTNGIHVLLQNNQTLCSLPAILRLQGFWTLTSPYFFTAHELESCLKESSQALWKFWTQIFYRTFNFFKIYILSDFFGTGIHTEILCVISNYEKAFLKNSSVNSHHQQHGFILTPYCL